MTLDAEGLDLDPLFPGRFGLGLGASGLRVDGERLVAGGAGIEEWWLPLGDGGIEHGFDVMASGGKGSLRFDYDLDGLRASPIDDGAVALLRDGPLGASYRFDSLAAWDDDGTALPARFLVEDGALAVLVEASGATFPIHVDPTLTFLGTRQQDAAAAAFGTVVERAGDTNGDGFDDVLVGAPSWDGPEVDEGKVWLYRGASTGLATTPAWSVEGNQSGAQLGVAMAGAEDINNDGYAEIAVGAPYFDNGQVDEGKAWVYFGAATGPGTAATASFESNYPTARLGHGMGIAQITTDAYADYVLASPNYGTSSSNVGRMWTYLGSAAGLATAAASTTDANHASGCWGCEISVGGDANADGRTDVLVGAPVWTQTYVAEGAAFLYLGGPAGLGTFPVWSQYGGGTDNGMGPVAWVGDVNGDGRDDAAVGTPYLGTTNTGRVQLFYGAALGGLATTAATSWTGNPQAQLGCAVDGDVDVDGDGTTDALFGARGDGTVVAGAGSAFLHRGLGSGLGAAAVWTAGGTASADLFGAAVALVTDLDNDGYGDAVVGVPGGESGQTDEGLVQVYLGQESDSDNDGDPDSTDCNDGSTTVYTGAPEISGNGLDEDCNGVDAVNCFDDNDNDGVGGTLTVQGLDGDCTDLGESLSNTDCNDGNAAVRPGAIDTPGNGIDEDCSGSDAILCFSDTDGDGYGGTTTVPSVDNDCNDPGESPNNADCNNSLFAIHPGAVDVPGNGIDEDCSGFDAANCYLDNDGDGYGSSSTTMSADNDCTDPGEAASATDCNDTTASVNPGVIETPSDGIDQDCSGSDAANCWSDNDGDTWGGFPIVSTDADCSDSGECLQGGDCNDTSASQFPGAPEIPGDAVDQDCDGADAVEPGDDDTPADDDTADDDTADDDTADDDTVDDDTTDDDTANDDSSVDDDSSTEETPGPSDDDSAIDAGDDDDDDGGRRRGGCSCDTTVDSGSPRWLLAALLPWILRRRRAPSRQSQ